MLNDYATWLTEEIDKKTAVVPCSNIVLCRSLFDNTNKCLEDNLLLVSRRTSNGYRLSITLGRQIDFIPARKELFFGCWWDKIFTPVGPMIEPDFNEFLETRSFK